MKSCQVDTELLNQTLTLHQETKEFDTSNNFENNTDCPQDQTSVESNSNPTEILGSSYSNLFTEKIQKSFSTTAKTVF